MKRTVEQQQLFHWFVGRRKKALNKPQQSKLTLFFQERNTMRSNEKSTFEIIVNFFPKINLWLVQIQTHMLRKTSICLQPIARLAHCTIQEEKKLLSITLTIFSNSQQFVKPKKLFLLIPFTFSLSKKLHFSDLAKAT